MNESVKTTIIVGGVEIDVEVFHDKILFVDADSKYEQRLDVLQNLVDAKK